MAPKSERRARKRAAPSTHPRDELEASTTLSMPPADGLAQRALTCVSDALCRGGHYAVVVHQWRAECIAQCPQCFLATSPEIDDGDVTSAPSSRACQQQWWCGFALCGLALRPEAGRDGSLITSALTITADLSPLLLRVRTLTALTEALRDLPRTPGHTHCVIPLADDAARTGVPWSSCCTARRLLEPLRGGEAVALLNGFPRVRLHAFSTDVGLCCAAPDAGDVTAAHWESLRPFVPPAFLKRAQASAGAWFAVTYPDQWPVADHATGLGTSHPATAGTTRPMPSSVFCLPALLVVASLSMQVGSRSIPPAYRPHTTNALRAAVVCANDILQSSDTQDAVSPSLTLSVREARPCDESPDRPLSLHPAVSLLSDPPQER